jgi:diamine N-acetyltransferase
MILLKEIEADMVRSVCELKVRPEQAVYVASNTVSMAEARSHPEAWFRAIYAGENLIGFVMLEDWTQVPGGDTNAPICLWRFMIDESFQKMGYGKKALEVIVEHVRNRYKLGYMLTSCVEGTHSPKGFYKAFGFQETGEMSEGETVLRLDLR